MMTSNSIVLAAVTVLTLAPAPGGSERRQPGADSVRTRSAAPVGDPAEITRAVRHALRGDSLPQLVATWSARLARDSQDVAAMFGVATAASLAYDHHTADRLLTRLAAARRPPLFSAHARLERSRSLLVRNLLAAAAAQLDSAIDDARVAASAAAEAEIRVDLAYLRAITRGAPAGQAMLDSAARLMPPGDDDLRVRYLAQRANMLGVLGQRGAADTAAAAVRLAERTGDDWLLAYALRYAAKELELRGSLDSAVALFRRVEALLERERDRSALGVVLLRHAGVLTARGEYGEAKRLMTRALAEGTAATDGVVIGSSSTGLGAIALSLRDYAGARRHLEHALASFQAQGDTISIAVARYYLAMVASGVGDHGTARRELARAAETFERTGDAESVFEAERTLAALFMAEGDWEEADRALRAARATARRLDRPAWSARLLGDEGRLALRRGNLATAERLLARDIVSSDSGEHVRRYDARTRLAEVYARRGDLARAERELSAASEALDRYRATLGDRELRVLTFQATFGVRDDPAASFATVVNLLATGGRAKQAFALAERRRARELADELRRSTVLAGGTERPKNVEPFGDRHAINIARQLPAGSALLEYVVASGAPSTLFVVTSGGVSGHTIPGIDSLAAPIERFRALVEDGSDPSGSARALASVLVDPALAALPPGVTQLVIVPDGAMHRVPFDVLRTSDGRLLIERTAIAIAPSAAIYARVRSATPRPVPEPVRLLAFGDPAFAQEEDSRGAAAEGTPASPTADEVYRSAFAAAGGLPRLRESAREAALVARYATRSDVRTRAAASAAYLKRAPLDQFQVIHFATHALVDEHSVARTALALAPGEGETGFVTPGELAALRLDADLVVLSACRTASGVIVGGEGVQGLTAPLLQAGARSVVATSWQVGDRSTVVFIRDFYDAMAAGQTVADALRSAKLAAMRRGAPASEWAAFNIIGDPLVRVALSTPRRTVAGWWGALAVVAVASLLAGMLWWRRRAREPRGATA